MVRAATVGTHPRFVRMIRELIEERLSATPKRLALGTLGPKEDVCPEDCCVYQPTPRPARPQRSAILTTGAGKIAVCHAAFCGNPTGIFRCKMFVDFSNASYNGGVAPAYSCGARATSASPLFARPEQTRASTMISLELGPRAHSPACRIRFALFCKSPSWPQWPAPSPLRTPPIAIGSPPPAERLARPPTGRRRFPRVQRALSVPGASDVANFSIAPSGGYIVSFGANATNQGLLLNSGTVIFDMNANSYTITDATGTTIGTTAATASQLTIKNGTLGVDTATDRIQIGATLSTGTLSISTGGRLGNGTIDPNLVVGSGGTGTLAISDNGRADLGFLSLGHVAGSSGTTNVVGANAVLDTSDVVNVGQAGIGTLNVQSSARMTSAGATTIGSLLGSTGTATVTGLGSIWNQVGGTTIGSSGTGGLSIQSAGTVASTGSIILGQSATGVGDGVVTGIDSTWNMASSLQVGASGLGNFGSFCGGTSDDRLEYFRRHVSGRPR